MKINEIVNEGIWDTIKSGAGKIKQGVQNIQPRSQARKAIKQQQSINTQVLGSAQQQYNQFAAQLGGKVSVPQALAWYEQFAGTPATSLPIDTNPGSIQRWLAVEIPTYIANKAKAQIPLAQPPAVPQGTFTSNRSVEPQKQPAITPVTAKSKVQKVASVAPTTAKISAPANPGAPTSAEQAKLQQKIQAAMAQQP